MMAGGLNPIQYPGVWNCAKEAFLVGQRNDVTTGAFKSAGLFISVVAATSVPLSSKLCCLMTVRHQKQPEIRSANDGLITWPQFVP